MKRAAAVVLLIGAVVLSSPASGAPLYAFLDRPSALTVGLEYTSFAVHGGVGVSISIRRSIASRVEVGMTASEESLFDPYLKLAVVRDLIPVNASIQLGLDRWLVLSTWRLGPVQVDWGRAWGQPAGRWAVATFSAFSWGSVIVGVEAIGGAIRSVIGVRIYPGRSRMWGISLIGNGSGVQLTVGGTL